MGTYQVRFQYVTTGHTFFRNLWAASLDHLYEQFNDYAPYCRVVGADAITRIA